MLRMSVLKAMILSVIAGQFGTPKFNPRARHVEHCRRIRVPGPVNPAGTKIARLAKAGMIGMRGRGSNHP